MVVAPPNITLQSSVEWDSGVAYASLVCSVQSQTPAAAITWAAECHGIDISSSEFVMTQPEFQQSHMVVAQSAAHIPIYSHAGCTVTCVVEHRGLEKPENKSIVLPSLGKFYYYINPKSSLKFEPDLEINEWDCIKKLNVSPFIHFKHDLIITEKLLCFLSLEFKEIICVQYKLSLTLK